MSIRTTQERLEYLFQQKEKTNIVSEIKNILEDLVSDIAIRLESEFIFRTELGEFIASTCYVNPPNVGSFIRIGKLKEYEIVKVIHNFNTSREPGIIIIK